MGKFISYDFQGWPITALTLRELLTQLGGVPNENGDIVFPNSEDLDIYPRVYVDDGMGYGVNEEYLTDVTYVKGQDGNPGVCSVFREKELENMSLWMKSGFYPFADVVIIGTPIPKGCYLEKIRENNGKIEVGFGKRGKGETHWFPLDRIKWK